MRAVFFFYIVNYLISNDTNYLCFDDLARKFILEPDQELCHDYIKLHLAIQETWESAGMTSNTCFFYKHNVNKHTKHDFW